MAHALCPHASSQTGPMLARTMRKTTSTIRLTTNRPLREVSRKATSKGVTVAVNSTATTTTMSHLRKKAFCEYKFEVDDSWWSKGG